MAVDTVHPLSIRHDNVTSSIPTISAHPLRHFFRPLKTRMRFARVLRQFSLCRTHRQFSGEYPPLLSILSSVNPTGGCPMSCKNSKNPFQRGQTEIPRAPYQRYASWFGLLHLARMARHELYARVPLLLWPVFLAMFVSSCSVQIPDLVVCSVAGQMSAGANCSHTLTDETSEMNLDQWASFLEPQISPDRGAAICMSSADFGKLKTATEQLCDKAGRWCTFEVKATMESIDARVEKLQSKVMERRKKRDPRRNANRIQ